MLCSPSNYPMCTLNFSAIIWQQQKLYTIIYSSGRIYGRNIKFIIIQYKVAAKCENRQAPRAEVSYHHQLLASNIDTKM